MISEHVQQTGIWMIPILHLICATVVAQPQDPIAAVSFGQVIEDDYVLESLHGLDVTPRAAHIWVSGLSGIHREYGVTDLPMDEFIERARIEFRYFLEDAIEANTFRMKRSFGQHETIELGFGGEANEEIRSLLELRSQFVDAFEKVSSGEPIVYALEFQGNEGELEQLILNPMVVTSHIRDVNNVQSIPLALELRPIEYTNEFYDSEIDRLRSDQVYAKGLEIVTE